jgi:Domain of unknown function (DUF4288)
MWFCAAILKAAEHNGERRADSLWEEQFFLIESDSEKLAFEKAEQLASRREAPYKNDKGELISWQFVKVDRVYSIAEEKLGSGVEVFSRFVRDSEAKSLMTPFEEAKH